MGSFDSQGCGYGAGGSSRGRGLPWPPLAAKWRRGSRPPRGDWIGSLVTGQQDATGLMYRRNRYYNPATGQFTQSDPIGLAGG